MAAQIWGTGGRDRGECNHGERPTRAERQPRHRNDEESARAAPARLPAAPGNRAGLIRGDFLQSSGGRRAEILRRSEF